MLLGLLPPLALAVTALAAGNRWPSLPWRLVFLRVTVAIGAAMVLGTEAVGRVGGVTRPVLTVAWLLPIVLSGIWLMRRTRHDRLRKLAPSLAAPDIVLLVAMLAAVLLVAIVAWAAPVQTWDSLTYHMSRVAHWAQNASLRPFASGIERQLYMPPGAEIGFLQAYVLGAGDRWVNLVNWTAWVCSAILASFVAARLGAPRTAQLASAALVVSLPMAIIQASSTMTDLLVGMWLLACVGELLWMQQTTLSRGSIASFALAAGLAANTKPTAYFVLLPLGLWFVIGTARRSGWAAAISSTVLAGVLFGLVLLPYWNRNLQVYGSALGPEGLSRLFANQRLDPQTVISNLLRNASLHAGTPFPKVSAALTDAVDRAHEFLGIDPNDRRTTAFSEWTQVGGMSLSEVRTGNTLHAALVAATFILVPLRWRRMTRQIVLYALVLAMAVLLYSLIFKWQIFGNRLHLPFFMLACPLIGAVLGRAFPPAVAAGLGLGAILLAWPWLTRIASRPLLAAEPSRSTLTAPRLEQVFYYNPDLASFYPRLTNPVLEAACQQIGIALLGDGAEYPLWSMLGAPRQDLRIEWLVSGAPSAKFADPDFTPCAVICQGCPPEDETWGGLPRRVTVDKYALFLAE